MCGEDSSYAEMATPRGNANRLSRKRVKPAYRSHRPEELVRLAPKALMCGSRMDRRSPHLLGQAEVTHTLPHR